MIAANSPNLFVEHITTPMLVIHGDRDYRVPIGEALRLWAELAERHAGDDGTMPHKFLYFPDEGHWVLKPRNRRVWWDTVLDWKPPHAKWFVGGTINASVMALKAKFDQPLFRCGWR